MQRRVKNGRGVHDEAAKALETHDGRGRQQTVVAARASANGQRMLVSGRVVSNTPQVPHAHGLQLADEGNRQGNKVGVEQEQAHHQRMQRLIFQPGARLQ